MMNFNLDDESFDIDSELIVSRILNNHSDKIITRKNYLDRFGYDLICLDKNTKEYIGFVEVEKSHYDKLDGVNWVHSFLKRKVYDGDKKNGFSDSLRKYYEKTVYIKFNKNYGLNDCICCDINTIKSFKEDIQQKTGYEYNDKVFRTSKKDNRVAIGIYQCVKYIEDKFLNNKTLDNWMGGNEK